VLAALAAALALAAGPAPHRAPARKPAAGAPHASAPTSTVENTARARRGLLPRKERRTAGAHRRFVLRAPPPVWLEEPDPPAEAPAAVATFAPPPVPEEIGDGVFHGTLEGAHVEILLVRRRADGDGGPLVEATVEGALVDAVLLRRRDPAGP
jgi:hypothetical protein